MDLLKWSIQTIKNHTSPFCYQHTAVMGHMQDPTPVHLHLAEVDV